MVIVVVMGVMIGSVGGSEGWWEDLGLFEEPFDAMPLLVRGEVGSGCKSRSHPSSLTAKAASVRAPKGAASVSWRCGFLPLCMVRGVGESRRSRRERCREGRLFAGWVVPAP